jgi:hypothetical protein
MLKEQSLYMVKILFDGIYFSLQQIVVLVQFEAMWQLKKRVSRRSPCESELSPMVTCVESVVDTLDAGVGSVPVSYHPTNAPYSTINRDWYNSPI